MRISDWSSDLCSSDLFIVVSVEDRLRRRSLFQEPLAPGRSAEIGERRIIGIAAVVDPGLESVSALLLESGLKLLAIFQGRSEERRVGKECVITGRSRCARYS